MSDSGEKDQETYSGCIMKKEQRANVKIECLRGNTVIIKLLLIYTKHAAMVQ